MSGWIEFDEKASADASHKKVRARGLQCVSDLKMADTARSSKGRIAELQTALSELAASQVAMTEDGIDSKCFA